MRCIICFIDGFNEQIPNISRRRYGEVGIFEDRDGAGAGLIDIKHFIFTNVERSAECIHDAETYMYADDVAAVISAASTDQLQQKLSSVADPLTAWFQGNGIVLNV